MLPLDGIEERVLAHVPREVKVTVTASPAGGSDATLAVAERLADERLPGRAARLGAAGARRGARRGDRRAGCAEAGVREVFVPAGDATEPGQFPDAASLLRELGGDLRRARASPATPRAIT